VEVYPESFETGYSFSTDARENGHETVLSQGPQSLPEQQEEYLLRRGAWNYNLWSFRLETYKFSPGQYQINVSNNDYDPAKHAVIYGNLSSSKIFSIRNDAP